MSQTTIGKQLLVYFFQAVAFGLLSYGAIWLIYGAFGISLWAWILIVLAAFAVAYLPTFIRSFRMKRRRS